MFRCVLMIFGCDYSDPSEEELQFLIVEASDYESAKRKAEKILVSYSIPKRNIVNLFEIEL